MSVKAKLARQAVKTTAKHSARGTVSKFARRPFRSVTLLALGVALGGLVGFLVGRSGRDDDPLEPPARAPDPASVAGGANNSAAHAGETGAAR